jgi:GH25 family lysozyme M1 (1,4-beta-N-acetylmuramidase)
VLTTRRSARLPIPQLLAAIVPASVLSAGLLLATSHAAGAATAGVPAATSPGAGHPNGAAVVWAMTASGRKVPLTKPVFPRTPLHRERITHPGADSMGAVTSAHGPWAKHAHALPGASVPQLPGIDISSYQGNINWAAVAPHIDFVYAKATEGTYYTNPDFSSQYVGPYDYGVIRGAYHFAIPDNTQGQTQADYFVSHGGGWSGDGLTLPGVLDIEYNPYGATCYGLSQSQMVTWISNFINEYAYREGVYPVIYTTTDWWTTCTGNYSGFAGVSPLWIANYSASGGGTLPSGWGYYTFWQYADSGSQPGDQDVFNGAYSRLQALAANG